MTLSHIRKQHEHQTSSIQLTSEKSVGGTEFQTSSEKSNTQGNQDLHSNK